MKKLVIVNDLLKKDGEQLTNIAEILLFIAAISSKKDDYIDRLSEFEDVKYVNSFFSHIEKFIVFDSGTGDETGPLNHSGIMSDKGKSTNRQTRDKLREEFREEKDRLLNLMKETEKELSKYKSKCETLEKNFYELEYKYSEKERECEIAKNKHSQNIIAQEEMFKESLTISELMSKLNEKELLLVDITKEKEMNEMRYNEEINRLSDKLESYDDKIQEFHSLKTQNEKLNMRIKEMKDKLADGNTVEEYQRAIDAKNKQIEAMIKEKQQIVNQNEKITKELFHEKEKTRASDHEKKRLEFDLNDMKRELVKDKLNMSEIKRNNLDNSGQKDEDDGNSMILKNIELEGKQFYEREFNDLKTEKNDLIKLYKSQIDEIRKLVDEREKMLTNFDLLQEQVDKANSEKERLNIERDKLEIQIQKHDLENQKLKMQSERAENERRRYENQAKEYEIDSSEIDRLQILLNEKQNLLDKIFNEKKVLAADYSYLQSELDKFKQTHDTNTRENKDKKNTTKV